MPATGTFDAAVRVDRAGGAGAGRKRRALYAVTSLLLVVLVGLAVVGGTGVLTTYGVATAHVTAEGGGYELDVRYGTVSRPGLATPFEITVGRDGGLEAPVRVAVDSDYLSIWDQNALNPPPVAATASAESLIWEFTPPDRGDVLVVSLDGRIEPGVQRGEPGRVALVDDGGDEIVAVEFSTTVLP